MLCALCVVSAAHAQQVPPTRLPGAADADRVNPAPFTPPIQDTDGLDINIPKAVPSLPIPKEAKSIHFRLDGVTLVGMTAFESADMSDLYSHYIGEDVTLDVIYTIAAQITQRYRDAGYFLSLAYIPNQSIRDGSITIRVVEGYISKVFLEGEGADNEVLQHYVEQLKSMQPVTSDVVEGFLLRVNDIPGFSYRSVLAAIEDGKEGEVKLTLTSQDKPGSGSFSVDNSSSRFLGPHEANLNYSISLLPGQQTTLSGLSSLPTDKLNYGKLTHSILLAPDLTLELSGGKTKSYPGFTLDRFDIKSQSTTVAGSLAYQWIRQRQENLSFKLAAEGRNSSSTLLGSALSRDHVRTISATTTYDTADRWQGYDNINVTLTQGIDGLGSSNKNDRNLSRAEADPDFTKIEANFSRLQGIDEDWSLQFAAAGQLASGPLFSSEEFGYGGSAFGRSFDESEIVGDHGFSTSLELRYSGLRDLIPNVNLQTYSFLDNGQVWNDDNTQLFHQSGTSAGAGLRFVTDWGQSGNLTVAFPIGRRISNPIYGLGDNEPRLTFRVTQDF